MKTTMTNRRSTTKFDAAVVGAALANVLRSPEFARMLQPNERATTKRVPVKTKGGPRGRIPGFYFPRTKSITHDSANVQNVFAMILKAKSRHGITQKQVQDKLNLSPSTVWYALQQLRAANAVTYRQPEARTAA